MTQHNAQSGERRVRRHPFKRRDVERAMKSAKAEGLEIGAVEVVTRDGTRIRVFGKDAKPETPDTSETPPPTNPWDAVHAADPKRPS